MRSLRSAGQTRWMSVAAMAASAVIAVTGCGDESPGQSAAATSNNGREGQKVFERNGCTSCHSLGEEAKLGPNLNGLWGTSVKLDTGETVTFDEDYVRESLREPDTKSRPDYPGVMPTFSEGRISEKELSYLVKFLEEIGDQPSK